MPALSTWNLDPTRILTRRELTTVLADLATRAARYANSQRNLIIVRLACCCGLRVSGIAGLQLDDVVADVQRPHLRLRRQITKGKRARCVPMWWDGATLADIVGWKARRLKEGARGTRPVRLLRAGESAWLGTSKSCASPALSVGLQGARIGPAADADHPPWAAHFYLPRLGGGKNNYRGEGSCRSCQPADHECVPACSGG